MRLFANALAGSAIAVASILFPGLSGAQVELVVTSNQSPSIQTTIGPKLLSGLRPGATIGKPALVLSVRPEAVVQCVSEQDPHEITGKRVSFDQNGYFASRPLSVNPSLMDPSGRYRGTLAGQSLVIGGDVLRYSHADYVFLSNTTVGESVLADVEAGAGPLLQVAGVQGYCYLMPQHDSPPVVPDCITTDIADTVFAGRFDALPAGSLDLEVWSMAVPPANNLIRYTYTLRAVGGPVYDIALREQFPFFTDADSSSPVFGRSLGLDQAWSCNASNGGHCDARQGRSAFGLGYVRVTGGHLSHDGACLSLTAERYLRADGSHHESPFSNRLHVGAVYRRAPDAAGAGPRQLVTRRVPFSP